MEHCRDEETEAILRDIISNGRDEVASFLLDTVVGQLEERGEEEGYVHNGFGSLMPVQEQDYALDGFGDTMEVQGDRADCFGDRTESDQVYKLVKPVLTS